MTEPPGVSGADIEPAEAQRQAFEAVLAQAAAQAGGSFTVIRPALDAGLAAWRGRPQPQRPELAFGGLVQALLEAAPVVHFTTSSERRTAPLGAIAQYWPDGLVAFLHALDLYKACERAPIIRLDRMALRLPLWWSIRENLREEPGLAAPFLQLLAGERPNWHYWASGVPMQSEVQSMRISA